MLDRTFGLSAAGTTMPTELRAGLATFLTMAYIMFVNPAILEKAGMDHGAVFVATCLAAALSTAIMGLYANYPIALAPGMGLNAYFAFTMVPELGGNWQLALGIVFLSGAPVPPDLAHAIARMADQRHPAQFEARHRRGIGLFLALIGLQNAGLVAADATTLVKLGEPTEYIPALTIALMIPLSYSIATGIGLGFIAYVALKLLSGRVREINAASGTIAGAFLLKLIFA